MCFKFVELHKICWFFTVCTHHLSSIDLPEYMQQTARILLRQRGYVGWSRSSLFAWQKVQEIQEHNGLFKFILLDKIAKKSKKLPNLDNCGTSLQGQLLCMPLFLWYITHLLRKTNIHSLYCLFSKAYVWYKDYILIICLSSFIMFMCFLLITCNSTQQKGNWFN